MASKREFEQFYQDHFDKVHRFVFFRVGGNRELAEDLVSEIFLKALEHFASYDVERSRSAWIITIARNHLANYWRDRKITEPLPGMGAEAEGESDAGWLKTALESWQKQMRQVQLFELLAKLESEVEREIVTQHYIFGYSYAAIGVVRNMTEGAVKVAAHRAIKKLRKLV